MSADAPWRQMTRTVESSGLLKFFERLHGLGLLEHHKLSFCEHRIPSCCRYDIVGSGIRTVEDRLVEIPFIFFQCVVDDGIAYHVRIERLLPHKKIYRSEYLPAGIGDYLATQSVYLSITFCHKAQS